MLSFELSLYIFTSLQCLTFYKCPVCEARKVSDITTDGILKMSGKYSEVSEILFATSKFVILTLATASFTYFLKTFLSVFKMSINN